MSKKIFITSGGTGGHIIPARCLAQFLAQEKNQEKNGEKRSVTFFGDAKYRSYIKAEDGFKSVILSSSQLVKSPVQLIKAAVKIGVGILQSLYFLLCHRPQYVVAFGGYSTFPLLVATLALRKLTKTKIVLHEQNSHLGKVNRLFAKYADKIALSFEETSGIASSNKHKTTFVGNPVRDEILQLRNLPYQLPEKPKPVERNDRMNYDVLLASDFTKNHAQQKEEEIFNILVLGGSGGARIFSEILPKAFFNFSDDLKNRLCIFQQCRKELIADTFAQYKSYNVSIIIDSFFTDMASLIAKSHLVIARSGSSSIFEFAAAKKPMILIPFAQAADNHQEKNARYFEKHGAAIVVSENEFTISKAYELIKNLIASEESLQIMSKNAASLAVPDATKNLANLLI
jgi:UDP-N-acetylglucosamine--N-acetylmuramyl-(pentapeptide) pyrophosphoryl-undecaprenol N-acetylglucosamine transferase